LSAGEFSGNLSNISTGAIGFLLRELKVAFSINSELSIWLSELP
jgi:hypothetical protein